MKAERPTATPSPQSHSSTFVPTPNYHPTTEHYQPTPHYQPTTPHYQPTVPNYYSTTQAPIVSSTPIALTSPKYQKPAQIAIVTTEAPQSESEEYENDSPHQYYQHSSTPAPPSPTKILYQSQVTTLSPITHNEIKPTTFSPHNNFYYKYVKIKDSQKYSVPVSTEPTIREEPRKQVTHLRPINVPDPIPTPQSFLGSVEDYQEPLLPQPLPLVDLRSSSLADILGKLQETNHLPKTLTAENIDNSIKTLVKILNKLKQTQAAHEIPEENHQAAVEDYDYHGEYDNFNAGEYFIL